ncbi:SMP-30/gluconolactonase/LRE family protein [Streptomyces triticiradicis]|uniref:SMP-30/gluconolactonase/LRE family protein n=1 Tax=Streptomyces triticiradicis TaxID=2651189 RepID=A0A7J5DHY7_9ACTN|nr:SMP-30/gluconolactonase/LRE family protein [Streptomyces triticiradicis]KAB1988179.1 SMP-30/gluconolactonase/LRE family protein [Streptomyces triticiradicis]
MSKKLSTSAVTVGALIAAAATALSPVPASALSAPLSNARIAAHFDLAKGQTPENIALAPGGRAYVTFAKGRQIAEVSRGGAVRILATLPEPADGGIHTPALGFPLTVGIVRAHDGTLYFLYATGTADLTGVWRLRPGGQPQRIAALPANGLPNGLALDPRTHTLYVADSVLGTIWSVPATGGTPTAWSAAPELDPAGFLGANGLKVHNDAIWATNLDKGTVLRIPVLRNGSAGRIQTRAADMPGIDDIAFTGHGDQLLAALDTPDEVALVQPDGTHSTVLTSGDGLQNPTSIALRGQTVHVLNAGWLTAKDPNLLLARLDR